MKVGIKIKMHIGFLVCQYFIAALLNYIVISSYKHLYDFLLQLFLIQNSGRIHPQLRSDADDVHGCKRSMYR